MIVYDTEKHDLLVPLKSYCDNPEQGAIDQALNLARLPFIFKQVCLMPDTHQGYGMPIGGVIATKGVVIPNAVGVDIGCGMCAVKISLTELSVEQVKKIFGGTREHQGGVRGNVPVGFNHRNKDQVWEGFDNYPDIEIVEKQIKSAKKQLGTLGGGNHFIELQKGDDGHIWIMIHSGSRNVGYQIAKHYNKIAQDLCKKWYSNIPKYTGEDGLAFLPLNTREGQEYLQAMNFALDFALANRRLMMDKVIDAIHMAVCPDSYKAIAYSTDMINIHHNYASMENHFGQNVMIHRKGATSARLGQLGIIPGSQGTSSYIVKGKGNIESFQSCSHGAGRTMSRKKAIANLDLEAEQKKLDDLNIVHSVRHKKNLDECSSSYKDIDVVMEEQKDLVDIVVKLKPLGVVKG